MRQWKAWEVEELVGLGADLLWGPVVETFQLFLPPSLMPSIKYWYLEVCAWHGPHVGKLGTDVVVPLLQILHRTLLRIQTRGGGGRRMLRGRWEAWHRGWAHMQVHNTSSP